MIELESLRQMRNCMDSLAKGVDPTSGEILPEDTVLNNIQLSRCFFSVSDILRQVSENGGVIRQRRRVVLPPFALQSDMRDQIEITPAPTMIKHFTDRINGLVDAEAMQKLKVTALTSWLVQNGYLREEVVNDKKRKEPTNKGEELGILSEFIEGRYGGYLAIRYSENAQRLLVSNLDQIIAISNGNEPTVSSEQTVLNEPT